MTSPYLDLPCRSVDEALRDRYSTEAMHMTDPIMILIAEEERLRTRAIAADQAGDEEAMETYDQAAGVLLDRIHATEPTSIENAAALLALQIGRPKGFPEERYELGDRVVAFLQRFARSGGGARPIATAPITPGEYFHCLVRLDGAEVDGYAEDRSGWICGRWNGEQWADDDGRIVHPTLWAPLPGRSDETRMSKEREGRAMKMQITDLPFVADVPEPGRRRKTRRCFWRVEPTGDYERDCITGHLYAINYMRYEIAHPGEPGFLPTIVQEMDMRQREPIASGIEVGFLSSISRASVHGLGAEVRQYNSVCRMAGFNPPLGE